VVTVIGPVHIEFFNSVEDIAREKGALLQSLPPDGHAVLCRDDPYFEVLRSYVGCTLHTVSMKGTADYVMGYDAYHDLLSVCETASSKEVSFRWSWPGSHNALNAGYAIAVARGMGVGWDVIGNGLDKYRPLSMRWDVEDVCGIQVINDAYNANPLSMRAALQSFEETNIAGSKWLVLGAMMELGDSSDSEHILLGEKAATGRWGGVIVIGEDGKKIASGMQSKGFDVGKIWCCDSNKDAVAVLYRELESGDGILLKASRSVALENVVEGLKKTYKENL
jgi:UDP-N-acetylmuramoyl-tripeptide--D-alanyl-D-alanine ligase